jgi:hypothetical protein
MTFTILENIDMNSQASLESAFRDFIGGFDLHQYLLGFVQNRKFRPETLSDSFKHENGFDKICLFKNSSCALRLHVWWPYGSRGAENIHNHRWDACSWLATGTYISEVYELDGGTAPLQYFEYEYHPTNREKQYELAFKGKARLRVARKMIISEGQFSSFPSNMLHRVVSDPSKITVSLFLTGHYGREFTSVFSEIPLRSSYTAERFSEAEIVGRVERLRDFFAARRGNK